MMKQSYRFCSTVSNSTLKSSLCVVGPIAVKVAKTVIPDLNPKLIFKDGYKSVEQNLEHRRIDEEALFGMKTVDVLANYDIYASISSEYEYVKKKRSNSKLSKEVAKELRERQKTLQKELNVAEEDYLVPLLRAPNNLDARTPVSQDYELLYTNEVFYRESCSLKSHKCFSIEFEQENPSNVFLKGRWPKTELDLLRKVQEWLQKGEFCDLIAPPDIVRSTVIEGFDPLAFGNPARSLALAKSNDFGDMKSGLGAHLVGAASIPAMVSFFVKNLLVKGSVLPINLFSIGKQYWSIATGDDNAPENPPSLFTTQQSSCVGLLSLNQDQTSAETSFQEFKSKFQSFYDTLGLKYRLVYSGADRLALAESLRLEAQMWSPLSQTYVTVGSLSKFDDYISRRLLLKYVNEDDQDKTLHSYHIVGGTFIDTYKVIGCMLESEQ